MNAEPSSADRARVAELLGREPQGRYTIAARDDAGDPTVIRNAPFLDDGTPMPTMFWLIGPDWVRRVGQLEAGGGVERRRGRRRSRRARRRARALRRAPRGDDPGRSHRAATVGRRRRHPNRRQVPARPLGLAPRRRRRSGRAMDRASESTTAPTCSVRRRLQIDIGAATPRASTCRPASTRRSRGASRRSPQAWFADHDPPHPASLTNALGTIDDHLDDVDREHPRVRPARPRRERRCLRVVTTITIAGSRSSSAR